MVKFRAVDCKFSNESFTINFSFRAALGCECCIVEQPCMHGRLLQCEYNCQIETVFQWDESEKTRGRITQGGIEWKQVPMNWKLMLLQNLPSISRKRLSPWSKCLASRRSGSMKYFQFLTWRVILPLVTNHSAIIEQARQTNKWLNSELQGDQRLWDSRQSVSGAKPDS